MRQHRASFLFATILVGLALGLVAVGLRPEPARAQTACGLIQNVSGTITGDTVWSPANLYVLTGDVTVNAGATLFIQPGTVVKVKQDGRLVVNGTLTASMAAATTPAA
jgi:hypothetical protein